jgi:ATP-dependent nuclease, subunit B
MQTGEVSRFMHQLYYNYGVEAKKKTISFDISFGNAHPIEVEKTPAVMAKLLQFTSTEERSPSLSASSINTYIDCPLQFYLTRVESIEEVDEVQETVEASMFGTLFHKVMENLYLPFKGKIMNEEDFNQLIERTLQIDLEINRAFSKEYFKKKNNAIVQLEGNNLLIASVLRKYILQVLKTDKKHAPFRYISSEEHCKINYPILNNSSNVNIKGFIDRIDEKEGRLRILDYKTGTGKLDFKNLAEVFEHNKENRPKFVLQTLLYCLLYEEKSKVKNTSPGIFYIRDVFKDDFETELLNKELKEKITAYSAYENEFRNLLTSCLEEIFNPEIPFVQTENAKICQYCPYIGVCNR